VAAHVVTQLGEHLVHGEPGVLGQYAFGLFDDDPAGQSGL
jgi:hypothetical protein